MKAVERKPLLGRSLHCLLLVSQRDGVKDDDRNRDPVVAHRGGELPDCQENFSGCTRAGVSCQMYWLKRTEMPNLN